MHNKARADQHRLEELFKVGDMVLMHQRKNRLLASVYQKLLTKGSIPIQSYMVNDNAYVNGLPRDLQISNTFSMSDLIEYHPLDEAAIQEED